MASLDLKSLPEGAAAIPQLKAYVLAESGSDVETVKQKEEAITKLSELLVKEQEAQSLASLLSQLRGFFSTIPKAKTAKIVRNIIDSIAKIPGSTQLQVGEPGLLVIYGVDRVPSSLLYVYSSNSEKKGFFAAGRCVQGAGGVGQDREAHVPQAAH